MQVILASSSKTRKRLLKEAHIPFVATTHTFDERSIQEASFANAAALTQYLAEQKAAHAILPPSTKEKILVLGADTIVHTPEGKVFHKPHSYENAVQMLLQYNETPILVTTGLAGVVYDEQSCNRALISSTQVTTKFYLSLSLNFIKDYLAVYEHDYQHVAGGLIIEDFGAQCVVSIEGSYTSALGLPMHKIRELISHYPNIKE